MKKTRFLALALSLILLVSVLPLAAAAVSIEQHVHFWEDAVFDDVFGLPDKCTQNVVLGNKKVTVDKDTFGPLYCHHWKYYQDGVLFDDGLEFYDFAGIALVPGTDLSKVQVQNGLPSLNIPAKPDATKDPAGAAAWETKYGSLIQIYVGYVPHVHQVKNAPWFADNNNHWKVCPVCNCEFAMNWHHDIDDDGICDECHQPVTYRYVTVKDAPGGKVTVSKEKCMLGNRVSITVTPDAGYKLQEIHGVNNNSQNSPRPCFKSYRDNQYFMYVDVWDIEVQPTFVKE